MGFYRRLDGLLDRVYEQKNPHHNYQEGMCGEGSTISEQSLLYNR
jgi:hypothetical protein